MPRLRPPSRIPGESFFEMVNWRWCSLVVLMRFDDKTQQPARDEDDLDDLFARQVLRDARVGLRDILRRCLIGTGGYQDFAADLAIHLHGNLDFRLDEQRGVK